METGTAVLRYVRLPGNQDLSVRGALAPINSGDAPVPASIAADLAALTTPRRDPQGRPVLGLPRYGAAWHDNPAASTWGSVLNADPRHRGVAGLGVHVGVALQDELVDVAVRHAGALDTVAQRVRELALGLAAAASLWRRHLPSDAARQLWLFGPALRRVVTNDGPVATLVTAPGRPVPPALFSSAARRVLRRGPARTAGADSAASDPAAVMAAANRCPLPPEFAEVGVGPFAELGAGEFDRRREGFVADEPDPSGLLAVLRRVDPAQYPEYADRLEQVFDRARQSAERGNPLPWTQLALLLAALGTGDPPPEAKRVEPPLELLEQEWEGADAESLGGAGRGPRGAEGAATALHSRAVRSPRRRSPPCLRSDGGHRTRPAAGAVHGHGLRPDPTARSS